MSFGKNLRYLRKQKNLSQEQIADLLGYKNYTTIQKWESDQSEPSVEKFKVLADYFDVSMDQLLNSDLSVNTTNINHSVYGNHNKNLDYFSEKPELLEIYKEIHDSNTLQLLFDQAKDLAPEDLETVLMIIKGIKSERSQ